MSNKAGILMLAAMVLMMGCSRKEEKDNKDKDSSATVTKDLMFESYVYDMAGEFENIDSTLEAGAGFIRFTSQGVLPQILDDNALGTVKLRDSLMSLAGITTNEIGKPTPVMPDSMYVVDAIPDSIEDTGFVNTKLTATLVTPRVVVWEAYKEALPFLSAHGNISASYVNYCLTDNRILEIKDIMKPGYEGRLLRLIKNKVREQNIQLLGRMSEIEIPEQFAITSNGLLFSYDPYVIAPYSEGIISLELSYDEVRPLLNSHGLFIFTGEQPDASGK